MLRFILCLSVFVGILALPHQLNREKRDDQAKSDQIAFPKEDNAEIAPKVEGDSEAPAGNGTDLDSRFLGVGVGLGLKT